MQLWQCLGVVAAVAIAAPAAALPSAQTAVEAAMSASASGWNAGDIDKFLNVYSDAPDTSFVTKEGLVRGKGAMRARYLAHYDFSSAAKRGTLTFATLDFRILDPIHALYIGRYTLSYPDGKTQNGPTSLVFSKEHGGWHIIADHSS
ncbi:MAG: SgcJ/EcaC family oxidoreductase [Sphingomonas sp.]